MADVRWGEFILDVSGLVREHNQWLFVCSKAVQSSWLSMNGNVSLQKYKRGLMCTETGNIMQVLPVTGTAIYLVLTMHMEGAPRRARLQPS